MKRLTFAVSAIFALSLFISVSAQVQPNTADTPKAKLSFEQIFFIIKNNYLYDIDIKKCQYEILKGLSPKAAAPAKEEKTACLDKHSVFHDPDEAKLLIEEMSGHFGGIGLELETKNDAVTIKKVIENRPAEKSGFQAGDSIIKVREENDTDWTQIKDVVEAVKKIRGPVGTAVVITVERAGTLLELKAVREDIKIKATEKHVFGDIGYVRLKLFTENSADEFEDDLRALLSQGINKVVWDLRNNPGGNLYGALENLFGFSKTESDIMLTTRWKNYEDTDTIKNSIGKYIDPKTRAPKNPGEFSDMKIVVLVNKNSASASEIVAGTLQDWGYIIIGETTRGKGTGQTMFRLIDGSVLQLTTFEYSVGNGKRQVNKVGINPDIEVLWQPEREFFNEEFFEEYNKSFGDPLKDPQLKRALEEVNKL